MNNFKTLLDFMSWFYSSKSTSNIVLVFLSISDTSMFRQYYTTSDYDSDSDVSEIFDGIVEKKPEPYPMKKGKIDRKWKRKNSTQHVCHDVTFEPYLVSLSNPSAHWLETGMINNTSYFGFVTISMTNKNWSN